MKVTKRDAIKVLAVILLSLFGLDLLAVFFGPARPAVFYVPTASAQTQTRTLPPDAVISALRAVVALRIDIGGEFFGSTGWLANDVTLVTVAHAFGPSMARTGEASRFNIFRWRTFPFYGVEAVVVLSDEYRPTLSLMPSRIVRFIDKDIGIVALSRVETKGAPSVSVRAFAPHPGEMVWWACSNRQGEIFSGAFLYEERPPTPYSKDTGFAGWQYEFPVFIFHQYGDGDLPEGCSGAPVFDRNGLVVGMMSSKIVDKDGYLLGVIVVRGEEIRRALNPERISLAPVSRFLR